MLRLEEKFNRAKLTKEQENSRTKHSCDKFRYERNKIQFKLNVKVV